MQELKLIKGVAKVMFLPTDFTGDYAQQKDNLANKLNLLGKKVYENLRSNDLKDVIDNTNLVPDDKNTRVRYTITKKVPGRRQDFYVPLPQLNIEIIYNGDDWYLAIFFILMERNSYNIRDDRNPFYTEYFNKRRVQKNNLRGYYGYSVDKSNLINTDFDQLSNEIANIFLNGSSERLKPQVEEESPPSNSLVNVYKQVLGDINDATSYVTNKARIKSMEETMNELLKRLQDLILTNKQIILTGAPGTGKTWNAKEIASELVNYSKESKEYKFQVEFIQFHPSYDYTDFMEGLKPFIYNNANNQNQPNFELKNGIFKEFCRKAGVIERILFKKEIKNIDNLHNEIPEFCNGLLNEVKEFWQNWVGQNKGEIERILKELRENVKSRKDLLEKLAEILPPFVFIIDEINRAELSKVFGELMYSLEPDYRGEEGKVKTQYTNMNTPETCFVHDEDYWFFVPFNVYIIGTMNDIDRSVEIFDFALRRRFAWYEMKVDDVMENVLRGMLKDSPGLDKIDEIIKRTNDLNMVIHDIEKKDNKWGLNEHYKIGPAYFGKIKEYQDMPFNDALNKLWDNHLKLLLFEYMRGTGKEGEFVKECGTAFLGSADGKQHTPNNL